MIPAERQALIVSRLSARGILSIAELAEMLGVSPMTVRRDIHSLEEQGRALSVAGGVQLPERIFSEPSHIVKAALYHNEKAAIGQLAAQMIRPGTVIYLDAGTTTLEIAYRLTNRQDLTVVTNDFVIAAFLSQESNCKLFHTGGEVERENQSCVGSAAGEAIRRFNFDLAFISTSSFGARGVSTPSENKIAVKRAVVESAVRRVLVTDSSKYGLIGTFNAIPLDVLSAVVTDAGLPENARETITQRGVELHLVEAGTGKVEGKI
ncbi:transcriptional regulator, DeoR family [Brucella vulpis]|uniref:DeoR/GlpR family DNA-binding transcription regulator n=1 Tax=Brucella vulpis TaxID=981386 RepID=UPI00073A8A60|nr:transcriptional regulator, DeoR family [Brucella vulpis]CUW51663.1 transcriptional regulator, DeoR family [Brucella vulpis]